jgi:hypothetical protein
LVVFWSVNAHHVQDLRTRLIGNAGLGARYYLTPTAPAFFLSGTLGYEKWDGGGNYYNSYTGPGGSVSVGYEFLKNYELETGLLLGQEGGGKIRVITLGINRSWY